VGVRHWPTSTHIEAIAEMIAPNRLNDEMIAPTTPNVVMIAVAKINNNVISNGRFR